MGIEEFLRIIIFGSEIIRHLLAPIAIELATID